MYAGQASGGSGGSWSRGVPSTSNSSSAAAALAYQQSLLTAAAQQGLYSTATASDVPNYHQLLLQRQHHQAAQQQAVQQQQQQQQHLLQQQAARAQAELRARGHDMQSTTGHQQLGHSTLSHVQHQSGPSVPTQRSASQLLNPQRPTMYGLTGMHHGSSGGSVTSVNPTSLSTSTTSLTSHLSTTSSSRSNMAPPSSNSVSCTSSSNIMPPPRIVNSNSMLPPPTVPLARGGSKDRASELLEKKNAAQRERQRERENRKRREEQEAMYSKALFDAPIKTASISDDSRQVSNILGDHSDVASMINSSTVSFIGIEYQPPTPATPANHHIIGGEDDEPVVHGSGNVSITDAQSGGINHRGQGQIMNSSNSHYFAGHQTLIPYTMSRHNPRVSVNSNHPDAVHRVQEQPLSVLASSSSSNNPSKLTIQQQPHISSDSHFQQPSAHPPQRIIQSISRPPSHQPPRPQNQQQLQLIRTCRAMGTSSLLKQSNPHEESSSPGESTSYSSQSHQTQNAQQQYITNHQIGHKLGQNDPLGDMMKMSNSNYPSNQQKELASSMVENQIRGSPQSTTTISSHMTNTSSYCSNHGLQKQQSPAYASASSPIVNVNNPNNTHSTSYSQRKNVKVTPLKIEAIKESGEKQSLHDPNSSSSQPNQPSLQAIFDEMKSIDKIPLTAIETPRVSEHEGNARNNPPKYSFEPSVSFPAPLISEPPPPTPITQNTEDCLTNKVSHTKSDPLKAPIHGIADPNLSEDSDSDQAIFDQANKILVSAKSSCNSNSIHSSIGRSEPAMSHNSSSPTCKNIKPSTVSSQSSASLPRTSNEVSSVSGNKDQSTSRSPNIKRDSQNFLQVPKTSEAKDQMNNSAQRNENGNSSSDSHSTGESSEFDSSTDEEEDAKQANNTKKQSSKVPTTNSRNLPPEISPGRSTSNLEASKLPGLTSTSILISGSLYNPANVSNLVPSESSREGLNGETGVLCGGICENEEKDDLEGASLEEYSLENLFNKVPKSTHSPGSYSQSSPNVPSQGLSSKTDSAHGESRTCKSGVDEDSLLPEADLYAHPPLGDDEYDIISPMLSNSSPQIPDNIDETDSSPPLMLDDSLILNLSQGSGSTIQINPTKSLPDRSRSGKDSGSKAKSSALSRSSERKKQTVVRSGDESQAQLEKDSSKKSQRKKSADRSTHAGISLSKDLSATSGNESSRSKTPKSLGAKNKPGPRRSANPIYVDGRNSDEDLGKDLQDLQFSPLPTNSKSTRKSSSGANKRKQESAGTFTSPPRRSGAPLAGNTTKLKTKSPSKQLATRRVEKRPHTPDESYSFSSSSEEDDKNDRDFLPQGRTKKPKGSSQTSNSTSSTGGKGGSKALPKAAGSKGKGGGKATTGKNSDNNHAPVISYKSEPEDSPNEGYVKQPYPSRTAKGKGQGTREKVSSGVDSTVQKKGALANIFKHLAQKKSSEVNQSNSRGSKTDNRSNESSVESKSGVLACAKKEAEKNKDVPSPLRSPLDDSGLRNVETSHLPYRSKIEGSQYQRPLMVCRVPLTSLKNLSQNLNIFKIRDSLLNGLPSSQLDTIASIVSPSRQQTRPNENNGSRQKSEPSSERSIDRRSRDRNRHDSSASSNISVASTKRSHLRKKRSLRHRCAPEESSDSDQGGSVHSSASNSHSKRRRKDPLHGSDADTTATLNTTTSLTLSEDQAPLTTPVSRHVPFNVTSNQEQVSQPRRGTSQNRQSPQQLYDQGRPPEQNQQHSGYSEVEYYDYSEQNETTTDAQLPDQELSSRIISENPAPSTSNGTNDTQSHQSRMMPPPNNKMFYSYLEQRRGEDDQAEDSEVDPTEYMLQGKGLKHEADKEPDRERQAMKYLKAVLYFILYANANEQRNDKQAAFTMYQETLNLVKHVCRPFKNSEFGNFDNKLAVISLRCQSLLSLKLYKMRRHELRECQKIIGDHIQKATSSNASQSTTAAAAAVAVPQGSNNASPNNGNVNGNSAISPTPSPAGSEGSVCSKSSGYTSSGEQNIPPGGGTPGLAYGRTAYGVLTPPTNGAAGYTPNQTGNGGSSANHCLSVPSQVMQKQHQFCSYLSQCHELWELADMYAARGHCKDFIIRLDQTCGPLTLHSSLKELVRYTQEGLHFLSKEIKGDES